MPLVLILRKLINIRRLISAATPSTVGTWAAIASASLRTRVRGKSKVALRALREPGKTNITFGPRADNLSVANFCAPSPMPIMATTEALPIIIPNMVKALRSLLAMSIEEAIFKLSTNSIVYRG